MKKREISTYIEEKAVLCDCDSCDTIVINKENRYQIHIQQQAKEHKRNPNY